ncbi:MAG: hypothetical protein ACTSQF_07350 [Candidatus Heimdallarchaeaceae archaeon]
MSKEVKPSRKKSLKQGAKLKTKPAVVPKRRKIKSKTGKMPMAAMMPKGITKWNIIFTTIFGALLIVTIVNSYFYTFLRIPLPDIILQFLEPAILIVEVFIVLVAFEAKAFKFPKIHTRHSVKRILITGFILGTLLISFFTPYVNLIGKYRDLPSGSIESMYVNDDWFDSLFTGSAPFYIDGLLDLLDALDLNDSLDEIDIARITAEPGSSLGEFLYRWEIRDTYQSDTWEFVESSPSTRFDLEPQNYGPPLPDPNITVEEYKVNQTVYSITTGLLMNMISTWSNNYEKPFLQADDFGAPGDWDDNILDANMTVSAEDGSANIKYNLRDMLSVQATTSTLGFLGSLYYDTYFAKDENISAIVSSTGQFGDAPYVSSAFNTTNSRFLQTPANYETISPNVASYAQDLTDLGLTNGHDYYQQITYILENIITEFGLPESAESDNGGQDRAELVVQGSDKSLSGYLALAIMTLRLNNIPCRPVFGFAIGNEIGGDPNDRMLELGNFYAWIEALIPIDLGGGNIVYKWGQFQMGPYFDGVDRIYCENTLYSSYDLDLYILNKPPLYFPVSSTMAGSELVYVTDYATPYTFRAVVSSESVPVDGVTVTFKTLTLEDYFTYQHNPILLLLHTRDVGTNVTIAGVAEWVTELNPIHYPMYVPGDNSTIFALLAYASLLSANATGFIVAPDGYLSNIFIDANKQIMLNPYPPPVGFGQFYIMQRGVNYTISTNLYDEIAHVTPLPNRLVTYYILDDPQMQAIIADPMNLMSITPWGQANAFTNSTGGSAVATQSAGFNFFENCSVSTTYYIVARYGQNYTVTILVYEDSKKSTIDISDDFHNKDVEGNTFTTDLDFYLYLEPTGGTPEPITNEVIDVWFVPQDVYDAATKTSRSALESALTASSFATLLDSDLTDGSGIYNNSFVIDVSGSYAGIYYVLVFYLDTWNISAEIIIADAPASLAFLNDLNESLIGEFSISTRIEVLSLQEKYSIGSIRLEMVLCEVLK